MSYDISLQFSMGDKVYFLHPNLHTRTEGVIEKVRKTIFGNYDYYIRYSHRNYYSNNMHNTAFVSKSTGVWIKHKHLVKPTTQGV